MSCRTSKDLRALGKIKDPSKFARIMNLRPVSLSNQFFPILAKTSKRIEK